MGSQAGWSQSTSGFSCNPGGDLTGPSLNCSPLHNHSISVFLNLLTVAKPILGTESKYRLFFPLALLSQQRGVTRVSQFGILQNIPGKVFVGKRGEPRPRRGDELLQSSHKLEQWNIPAREDGDKH